MQTAFDKMFALMTIDTLAAYPDHNNACIVQAGREVAYFSCKLLKSHQNYMVMEKKCYPL
ncbi:hypothetical protein ACHAW6_001890 [Cyclotella cf. meneghiniana]